jgi:hypothetical protein
MLEIEFALSKRKLKRRSIFVSTLWIVDWNILLFRKSVNQLVQGVTKTVFGETTPMKFGHG